LSVVVYVIGIYVPVKIFILLIVQYNFLKPVASA